MITFLRGSLVEKQPTMIVVEVGGVGYEALIPLSSFDRLPGKGAECRILTYDYVREDTHQLFGFMTEQERRLFIMLIGISGIGPKLALSALSGLTVRELVAAVVQEDVKRISSISGIGKRMAERIVVDLKDKVSKAEGLEAVSGEAEGLSPDNEKVRDGVLALISLGYKQAAARKMVDSAVRGAEISGFSVEDIIKMALARG